MGYFVHSIDIDMYFPANVLIPALAALQEAASKHTNNGWSEDICAKETLAEALEELCFDVCTEDNGDLMVESRRDEKLPMHNDDYLIALSPFVHTTPTNNRPAQKGGFITWMGEDNDAWKTLFEQGGITNQNGKLTFS